MPPNWLNPNAPNALFAKSIGIAPDMLPHIFELFVQADDEGDRLQGGWASD
ncbi:MAG: hypothetical protein ACLQGP_36060 [Isosphaeraceae bacterium]